MKQLSGLEQVIADRWLIFLTFKMNQMRLGRGDWRREDLHSAAPVVAQEPTFLRFPKAIATRFCRRGLLELPHQYGGSSRTAVTTMLYNQPSIWRYS